MSVKAFLMEPAAYTVDRNRAVYQSMGVDYCYLRGASAAKATDTEQNIDTIGHLPLSKRAAYMWRTLRQYEAVIFNGYSGVDFLLLFLLNLWHKRKIGIDSDTQYREPANALKRLVKRAYLSIVFGNKNVYGLAGGNFAHKDLFQKFGMAADRVLLMPMMVDNSRFYDSDYGAKPMAPFRFLYVGRLIGCKNIDFMIEAFVELQKAQGASELHIVGRGELEQQLISKYSGAPGVKFVGPLYGDDLAKYYRQCHVLILPSAYEPWGLVVNEAMAAGLPVLVSDEVGARYDLVDGKDTGFVFKHDDKECLINCMRRIAEADTYHKFSDNAYHLMRSYWNYDLYRNCLKEFINKA